MQAIALTTTSPTAPLAQLDHQPEWYLALDGDGRALIDEVLATLDREAPGLTPDERTRVFWNAMRRLGVPPIATAGE